MNGRGVRTTHTTQRLLVMSLAWGRGCLSSTKERNNFMLDTELDNTSKAKLSLITKKAAADPTLKFTSLIHLLNDEEYLYQCFKELERGKSRRNRCAHQRKLHGSRHTAGNRRCRGANEETEIPSAASPSSIHSQKQWEAKTPWYTNRDGQSDSIGSSQDSRVYL